ncbi:putative MFS-family transport protein [Klebsiella pneumoniae]|uniref:Putative MFS-family transport protein n=1 Tax=Klebsiella pneumoniae TaxID=573 RepID=A0A378AAH3_KLEPN|nr:putative MFS-family transport protein [Klebsiella pneumoniae]
MEFLDGTVIATALPDMARDFGVTAVELNIGISAYLITLAVLIPASGWIGRSLRRPGYFTLALAIFTLASVFCGLSTEVHIFVAMRILQGVGGALMVPVGRLAVLRTTPKHQLIKAIATLTWPALVAPIIGPPLGGFITATPAGTGSSLSMSRWPCRHHPFAAHYPDIRETERRSFDLSGFITTSVAMVSLVTAMERLGDSPAADLDDAGSRRAWLRLSVIFHSSFPPGGGAYGSSRRPAGADVPGDNVRRLVVPGLHQRGAFSAPPAVPGGFVWILFIPACWCWRCLSVI